METTYPPIMPDLSMARRLESHEAWSSSEHARIQAELYPQTGAAYLPIAGGYAVFCGKRSPLSEVYGLGMSGQVAMADLEQIEAFYRERARKVRLRVCPLADSSLFSPLRAHKYTLSSFMNVYFRTLTPVVQGPPIETRIQIRAATLEEARNWFERLGAGGDWAEPDGISFMLIRCLLKPGARLYLAWQDGEAVAGGALDIHEGIAGLTAAETLPAYRNRGIHTALLHARLEAAVEAGCDLAVVHTDPGTVSQNNVLRAGFQLAYTTAQVYRNFV